ncbi:MAG: hypothetical protein PUB49_09635 [Selenomonadaceae bacterium]|nr:hypothetical protein [Selenomonadaceae bacterium]
MENKKMKFVIVSPRQTGGGAIILHKLCKILADKGYDAKIFYIGPSSMKGINAFIYWIQYVWFLLVHDLKKCLLVRLFHGMKYIQSNRFGGYNYEPVRGCKRKWLPTVNDDTIVIYPEIVYGNPLRAKNVVRWLCYYYPYNVDDNNAYSTNDFFVAYRDIFNNEVLNPKGLLLKVNNFDGELYRNYNHEERHGCCYIIRKGIARKDLPSSFDGPIIDDLPEAEKIKVFNHSEYCYSYDTQTFYSSIAALCGCKSIVVLEPGRTKQCYRDDNDLDYGVAWGCSEEELQRAQSTVCKLQEVIDDWERKNIESVNAFLSYCDNFFERQKK